MGEFRNSPDEPDMPRPNDRPEENAWRVDSPGDSQPAEPRARAVYAADLEQQAVSGRGERPSFTERPGEAPEAVRRFEPKRAGLPDVSVEAATSYIESHQKDRPWLEVASKCPPDVQRVLAALDQGGGHGHIRHEGSVTEEMNRRRAAYLEDPVQFDPAKQAAGVDGFKDGQAHRCRQMASRIIDPVVFAEAFAQGIEHPRVRAGLEAPFDPDRKPQLVQVPIEELLGPDGHRYCTGWRLEPVGGSVATARIARDAWVGAPVEQRASGFAEPAARPVETFEGGTMIFIIGHNRGGDGYEVGTMYPRPPEAKM
jgi:hypothetical protein